MKLLSTTSFLASFACILYTSSIIRAQSTCSENEEYTNCASSTCFEETCVDVAFAHPMMKRCTKDCKKGCKCKEGFFRNQDGRCVTELTCIMCGYGENWLELDDLDDDNDEQLCDDLIGDNGGNDSMEEPTFPPDTFSGNEPDYIYGADAGMCICAKNLYRSFDGLCVSKDSCLKCGANEIFEPCGSSTCWEYSCDDALVPLRERMMKKPCTVDCRSGCKCHPGFYRDATTDECISAVECLE